ncbi:unnamed protein product [Ceutorhynchus assimilis]|uniref:RETREG1-3/ARL6IP-like N-terminal reticulon-homology domain-containing protein n=1 Tax=Ceutorhynchus assimilis TaxID=467358 RepID=A0A9N9MX33_9CUCU|nr:unnamed protein product [Ceutorhynchus assimilis]
MSDNELQIRKLKLAMAPYRELVLILNRVFLWDKQWHSTAILAGSSTVFTIIWLCNPNVMSIIAFMCIIATLLDFFLNPLLSFLFKPQVWTADKQDEFDDVCTTVILYKVNTELFMTSYYRMRVTNPRMYFTITVLILCILAWLGGSVDNMFLTYMVTTFFLMMPGMQRHGLLAPISKPFSQISNMLIENAKFRVEQKED